MVVRRVRASRSSLDGWGSAESIHTHTANRGKKAPPVRAGIQASGTPRLSIIHRPTLLTMPLATMYEVLSPAPRISDERRPSRWENTSPQIIPSGSPLQNMASACSRGPPTAKATSASSASPTSPSRYIARRWGDTSGTSLMPMILLSAYPSTCARTRTILRSMPQSSPSKVPAAKGLRTAYMQKYAPNAAGIAYAANTAWPLRSSHRVSGARSSTRAPYVITAAG